MKIQIVIISVHVRKIVRLPPTPGGGKGVKERVGVGGGGVPLLQNLISGILKMNFIPSSKTWEWDYQKGD